MTRSAATVTTLVAIGALTLGGCAQPETSSPDTRSPDTGTVRQPTTPISAPGVVPRPDADTTAAYIRELDAIDPDIAHGKPDKAVSRGRDQCSSVKDDPDDQARLVTLTNQRFTSPNHPKGHGTAVAEKILRVVRTHICPDY
ncbi:hypothetical protein [Amycolatopsis sp. cmx-11-32]|uniref:hypothetical protein n=1 Tax=Amycolatopsis sp. cmx-11-32 TaxID=2785796 RepID=UPI0039E63EB7